MGPRSNDQELGGRAPAEPHDGLSIVGIGASAGGVSALQSLFKALPDGLQAAFVVVVHLDPDAQSDLAAILGSRTTMSVTQVETSAKLEANRVYVIPPNRRLRIADGGISALEFDEPRGRRAPIDLFFRSLADQRGDGFAVILTGAGSDGAAGVKAVKEAGGIILVQDPSEAEFPSMPRSAIATGVADFVMPVGNIAHCLVELITNKDRSAILPDSEVDNDLLRRILASVLVRTGHDFSKYKRSTVLRRIARRMAITKKGDLQKYYDYVNQNSEEAHQLLGDLLISVTSFFRDGAAFETLAVQALPQLFNGKTAGQTIRVWVAGCASGEEAYTLGILLLEEVARHDIRPAMQIFASDLDSGALATAREGRYPISIEADIDEGRLRTFFSREGDHYHVRQHLRDMIVFANHSVLKDPPFSYIDLVSCRNLLIYLDRELQQQACTTFHYALNPGGFLLLGPSESADGPNGLFRAVHRKHRIYQTTFLAGDKQRLLPKLLRESLATHELDRQRRPGTAAAAPGEAAVHRRALEKIAPPNILVDDVRRVLHLSDNAGRYLQPAGGPLTGDIVDMVRPEFRFELRSALHQAFERHQSTLSMPIVVRLDGAPRRIYLQVRPVLPEDGRPEHAVVLFIEGEAATQDRSELGEVGASTDETVRLLSQELQATQSRLRTMREESEAANEELRAANEELQSINEEYRSTSEELETSKEELQSINEELQTVNNELKLKLEAVSRAHGDLQNLMAATDFGTLFLDQSLRIKRFTSRASDLFSITTGDEGRPITDFTHQLDYEGVAADARNVIRDLSPVEREIQSRNQRWYLMRMRPYRTLDDKIDGVVITFVDVTARREVEEALRDREERLRQKQELIELSLEPIFVWDFDDGIIEWNHGSEQLYGYSRDEAIGQRKEQLLATEVPGSSFDQLRQELLARGSWTGEVLHRTKGGRQLTVETRIELRRQAGRRLVLETTRDISDRKEWERRQQMLLSELTHRVKNTLAVVQSIAHHTLSASQSREQFIASLDGRLSALAQAHSLLVESEWEGAELGALARAQLAPLRVGDIDRFKMEGEPIILPPSLATPFGLVLHELATNAAKYGALSNSKGTVTLTWRLDGATGPKTLIFTWQERGGPLVTQAPRVAGSGTKLIERAVPNATVHRDFRGEGLVCTVAMVLPD
jgi:two-component system, chemotaxis family, CheB/CheR fusion protein